MEAVIAAARERGCHLELNADPDRLDLNDIQIHAAQSAGVKIAVSSRPALPRDIHGLWSA